MSQSIFSEILKSQYQVREKYLQQNSISAYRLYDHERNELPVAIDIYGTNAVIHLFEMMEEEQKKELEECLRDFLKIESFFYKNRVKEISPNGTKGNSQKYSEAPSKTMMVQEYGHSFLLNLSDYLDTGLFLDHRETRKWIEGQSKNKIVLNTFAYTGSFTVYAGCGGAEKTYSVDLSRTYCDWIKKNLELNHLPPEKNWVYKMDTLEFFRYAQKKHLMFDIIIIDPPSFSRNKGENFSVQKDHPLLINAALECLNPNGFILFSNNKRDFKLSIKKFTPCTIQDFQKESTPPDFTDPLTHSCYIIKPR